MFEYMEDCRGATMVFASHSSANIVRRELHSNGTGHRARINVWEYFNWISQIEYIGSGLTRIGCFHLYSLGWWGNQADGNRVIGLSSRQPSSTVQVVVRKMRDRLFASQS